MKLYDYLGIVAMIATPLAAAVLFGWQLHSYLLDSGLIPWLAIVGGLSGAVAIESVGIYAGHVGMDYARRRDWRGLVAGAALVFYVGFGWSKVPEYGAIFVIAAFVYVLVALRAEAAQVDGATAVVAKEDRGWSQRMELERERMKHQERLARIEAGRVAPVVPKVVSEVVQPQPQPQEHNPTTTTLTPAQLRVYEVWQRNPDATQAQIAEELGVTYQAVGKHLRAMNGLVK
jgi:DNA-binding CsgD family transcriptional regulator